jgi:hypothetical protein
MKYTSESEIVLSDRLVRLRVVTLPSRLDAGHSILLPPAELLTLVLQVIPHTTAVLSYGTTRF